MSKNDSCACCGRADFRKCACPWTKPFGDRPSHLLAQLKSNFVHGSGPHPNS